MYIYVCLLNIYMYVYMYKNIYMYVYMLMYHYKSSYTVPQPAAWLTMFLSAHVQYLCEAFA